MQGDSLVGGIFGIMSWRTELVKVMWIDSYFDWSVKPGQPKWHEPVQIIGIAILLSMLVMVPTIFFVLWIASLS